MFRRFIPTCVGNIIHGDCLAKIKAVHPHMRGEHPVRADPGLSASGSSPHAWGTWINTSRASRKPRFIPTCVGNMTAAPTSAGAASVHPHMRGEHGPELGRVGRSSGSSPHAWGTFRRLQ